MDDCLHTHVEFVDAGMVCLQCDAFIPDTKKDDYVLLDEKIG